MRIIVSIIWLLLINGGAQAAADSMRFSITRNGDPIGTHAIDINRVGSETSVSVATDLTVKVLFVTAYRFQQTDNERWVNGRLVALNSTTNNNGAHHTVTVTAKPPALDITADGKVSRADQNVMPTSFWSPQFLQRPILLDTQNGQVMPVSVVDDGEETLMIKTQSVKAHRYTIKSSFSQDVWYDDQSRLVQARFVASDGSIIMYQPL